MERGLWEDFEGWIGRLKVRAEERTEAFRREIEGEDKVYLPLVKQKKTETQKRSMSYISDCKRLNDSGMSENSVEVFERAANGMEMEPRWVEGLEED